MKRLWLALAVVMVFSFAVLGWIGTRIYQEMPPIPGAGRHRRRRGRGRRAATIARGPERLAVAGRHGGRLDLGTRQLRRPRLDGRLAASRGDLHPRRLGAAPSTARRYDELDAGAAGRAARAAAPDACGRTRYDPATQTVTVEPVRAQRVRGEPARTTRTCSARASAEYAIPRGARERSRAAAAAGGLLLLDRLGGGRRTGPGDDVTLHEQLAA